MIPNTPPDTPLPSESLEKPRAIDQLLAGQYLTSESGSVLAVEYLNALAQLEDASIQQRLLTELVENYVTLERKIDALLKNTLPESVAEEIKFKGAYEPREFQVSILFTDCVGFTKLAEKISGRMLIECLHNLFSGMDSRVEKFGGTKVKTIGDAYMAVFGAPQPLENHAEKAVSAALEILGFLEGFNRDLPQPFHIRVGIHSGPVMGGVVGRDRMQFDVFGDNVNIASRFESSGEPGKVNVSEDTRRLIGPGFAFEPRGEISLKNKAPMKAYFANRTTKTGEE